MKNSIALGKRNHSGSNESAGVGAGSEEAIADMSEAEAGMGAKRSDSGQSVEEDSAQTQSSIMDSKNAKGGAEGAGSREQFSKVTCEEKPVCSDNLGESVLGNIDEETQLQPQRSSS